MRKAIMVLAIGLGVGSVLFQARATTYYVATSGSDAAAGTSWTVPVASISTGVALATVSGDIVLVSNGTYTINNQITVANAITLASYNSGVQSPATTIIKGNYPTTSNRCLQVTHPGAVISGLTFTNGWATNFGGGVYMSNGGRITNCVIVGNVVTSSTAASYINHGGGGLWMISATATWCTISGNTMWHYAGDGYYSRSGGGGVYLFGTGSVEHCVINNNRMTEADTVWDAEAGGGGVFINGYSYYDKSLISDSTISANSFTGSGVNNCRTYGGGVQLLAGGNMSNCVVSANSASSMGYCAAGVAISYGKSRLDSCVISNNFGSTTVGGVAIMGGQGGNFISNCIIEGNTGLGSPGLYDYTGNGYGACTNYLSNCTLRNNFGMGAAGAVMTRDVTLHIDNCLITGNSSTNNCYGAAIGHESYGALNNSGRIRNCLITRNQAGNVGGTGSGYGGGISIYNFNGIVENCTIVSNRAQYCTGGLDMGEEVYSNQIVNCVIYNNSDPGYSVGTADINTNRYAAFSYASSSTVPWIVYSCSPRLLQGEGNITNNPAFVNGSGGDWHLTLNSPCVNSGTSAPWMSSARDFDGRERIDRMFGRVDMGCYEFMFSGTLVKGR